MRRHRMRLAVAGAIVALVTAGCGLLGGGGGNRPTGEIGGTVSVLGTWGGSEQESFLAMVRPFEEATGVTVQYEGTRDLNAVLTTRVQGNNPPDVAGLPGPGQMAELARDGALVGLEDIIDMNQLGNEYAQSWIDLGSVDGTLYGIFIKTSTKGFIWYDPNVWEAEGFDFPETWDELSAMYGQMRDGSTRPWCIGLESGDASGWPGTDWLEDIVLRQSGPEVYRQWYEGEIAWTSPEIRQAWETWGEIIPDQVFGGSNYMLATAFGNGGDPLFSDPPGCYMHHQASFITDFFVDNNPGLEPVTDFRFFGFPTINTEYEGALEVAGDLFGMFNDTPQARALIKYLTTPEAQQIWVERGGALSPNREVDLSAYPDEISREIAELLTGADVTVFDASDLMPLQMQDAFHGSVLEFVENPGNLDSILEELDRVRSEAY
ncbi:MAG: ABC transporter substrate-binding protein [Candidatus Limnocylindria bacterium]